MSTASPLALSPVISYPRDAEVGRTYLMTVDFQAPGDGPTGWAYPAEEFVVHCELDAAPLFSHQPVGEPTVVLHRFGGSYGPASFLLTAAAQEGSGAIVLHLSSGQGLPLASIPLTGVTVRARTQAPGRAATLPEAELPPLDDDSDEAPAILGTLSEEEFFPTEAPPPPPTPPVAPATPLDRGLAARLVEHLRHYWVGSAEELADLARGSNAQYGSGRRALAVAMGVEEDALAPLVQAAISAGHENPDLRNLTPLEQVFGLTPRYVDRPAFEAAPWQRPPLDVPPDPLPVALAPPDVPPMGNQGMRNTSVAFVLTAMYQILSGDPEDLSEQFLYWAAKDRDGVPGDVGTDPRKALDVFREMGVCREATWPYNPQRHEDHRENPGQGPPPEGALEEARLRRIGPYQQIPPKDVTAIKTAMARGWPVLLGLKMWEHWRDWSARALRKVRRPLPGERQSGGAALCLFGYEDDPEAPGGGFFLAHSAGTPSRICYALVAEQGLSAFAATGIDAHPGFATPVEPAPEPAPEPVGAAWLDLRSGDPNVMLLPTNGLGRDGRPLVLIDVRTIAELAQGRRIVPRTPTAAPNPRPEDLLQQEAPPRRPDQDDREQQQLHRLKVSTGQEAHLGVVFGVDPQDLGQTRWAVVVSVRDDARLLEAVWPLITLRMEQMGLRPPAVDFRAGETCGAWLDRHTDGGKRTLGADWGAIPPVLGYRPGERATGWLARHGVSIGPVDPARGVPYYLLLLGRPGPITPDDEAYIPPEVQRDLGVFWAVGRLCLGDGRGAHNLEAYTAYAEALVRVELEASTGAARLRSFTYVAPGGQEPSDEGPLSRLLRAEAGALERSTETGRSQRDAFEEFRAFLGGSDGPITKVSQRPVGSPSTWTPGLFTLAGHGLGLPFGEPRLVEEQGAFVSDGVPGGGALDPGGWLSGEEVRRDDLAGSVALILASFAAGSPPYDPDLPGAAEDRLPLAPFALIARLPQRLLRAGAAAVIAPYGRFWPPLDEGTARGYGDLIARLRQGVRVGEAFNSMALNASAAAVALVEELENIRFGKQVDPAELARLWLARASTRNLMLLGDPAAALPGRPEPA